MTGMMVRAPRLALLMVVVALACDAGDKAPKVSLAQAKTDSAQRLAGANDAASLSPAAQTALDSANMLFRKKAYAEALTAYRTAASRAPAHEAPLIGMSMVAQATRNKALEDSVLAAIRAHGGAPPPIHAGTPDSAFKKIHARVKPGAIS